MNMQTRLILALGTAALLAGCASRDEVGVTNQEQPGPMVGRTAGTAVGSVAGNVAGAGVGFVEGASGGVATSFDNTQRVVRKYRTETTPDGRTIQVPEEYLVDEHGRVIRKLK